MKPLAFVLGASLVANAAFAVLFVARPQLSSAPARDGNSKTGTVSAAQTPASTSDATRARASVSSRRIADAPRDLWSDLKTDDLSALIARLRAAGFPPPAIRAIVTAEINARFVERLTALNRTVEDAPFWRPAPTNSLTNPKYIEERQQLYRERSRTLRELLGREALAGGETPLGHNDASSATCPKPRSISSNASMRTTPK
jgi:hypothetical protein